MTAEAIEERWESAEPAYKRKISTYSRIHFREIPGFEQDDLEVELLVLLWVATRNYDPNHGATFNTYFWEIVKRKVIDLKRDAFRQIRRANVYAESLEVDAVRVAVDEMTARSSAEEEVLARITVRERLNHF